MSFTDASTDDGAIVSWSWEFGDGSTSTEQHPVHAYGAVGTYQVVLSVTDDAGLSGADTVSVEVLSDPNGPFLETGGLVVMEAEHFMTNIDRGGHAWVVTTAFAGYSGESAMQATPDVGDLVKKNKVHINSPELTYDVDFSAGGTYYIWVRVHAEGNNDNSLHSGLNGSVDAPNMETITTGGWAWTRLSTSGMVVSLDVPTAGMHTINVWMREDGIYIDKLLLTTDVAYVPTGIGPAESPRSSSTARGSRTTDHLVLHEAGYTAEVPDTYVLDGNFPNPFNPSTTIRFGLPETAHVSLVVYDMQGREMARLLDGPLGAGYHLLSWYAGHQPSGVYLYRLVAGPFSETGRMVLLK